MARVRSVAIPKIDDLKDPAHDAHDFAIVAARLLADSRLEGVTVLDLRGLSSLADFFVLGTGGSERQMSGAMENLRLLARELGRKPMNQSDSETGTWLLADYVDVVVHLFDVEHRSYYDLDGLWGDAAQVQWQANSDGAEVRQDELQRPSTA